MKEKEDRKRKEKERRNSPHDSKLKKAVRKEEENVKKAHQNRNDNKRGYNSVKGDNNDVSLEEIEAYKHTKKRFDDPMYYA